MSIHNSYIDVFDLHDVKPPVFFRSYKEIKEQSERNSYTHFMRRAWEEMELQGIYCVNQRPTVYFKEMEQIDPANIKKLHQQLWNQGIATILVVITPQDVFIYSGLAYPTNDEKEVDKEHRLVQTIKIASKALELRQIIRKIETGQFYTDNKDYFDPDKTVDQYLLNNLGKARDLLYQCEGDLKYDTIHALLGSLIFISYLRERKIITDSPFKEAGASDTDCLRDLFNKYPPDVAKDILFKLFKLLQEYFNGSIFDQSLISKKDSVSDEHIEIIRRFLNGKKLDSDKKQVTFDFWVYDFKIIPIETISAIYEDFISAENTNEQRRIGAYYTPKHLAEMVVDVALEETDTLIGKKFMDPACGSGIFLVILFNRIAEEWRFRNPHVTNNIERADALIEILQSQLCGIDIKETACRITCFSLYLALLDQLEPRDIHELRKQQHGYVLPDLLVSEEKEYKGQPIIFKGNFFDTKIPIPESFDVIIGNPPWVGRGQNTDTKALDWCLSKDNPFYEDAPKNKQERLSYFLPQNQVAHVFMWKTPLHLKENGTACLLLPSKLFLNKTHEFQKGWFSKFKVDKVIQLSDMSFILFQNADCPAMIVKFKSDKNKEPDYSFNYYVPKVDQSDPRKAVVSILPEDHKRIKISEILESSEKGDASVVWKKNFWGTSRDIRLIERLLELSCLENIVGMPEKPKRWITGQGFKPFHQDRYDKNPKKYGEPKVAWWPEDHLYLDARTKDLNMILLKSDCQEVGKKYRKLHQVCDTEIGRKLFVPPMTIVNQGFSKIIYCDFPVVFQHALQSIKGEFEDQRLLIFLTAILNSKLAKYFLFHTSANWGTERDKVHLFELMRMPFFLPEFSDDPSKSEAIIDEITNIIKILKHNILANSVIGRSEFVKKAESQIEPLIYEYYHIGEREKMLIEDTVNIFEPSSTPSSLRKPIPTLRHPQFEDRKTYVSLLCEVLNTWAKRSKFKVSGHTKSSDSLGIGIVTIELSEKQLPYSESKSSKELDAAFKRIRELLPENKGRFSYIRGLKIFDQKRIYIVKPLLLRFWTRTAALNDADELATAILLTGRKK